MTPLARRLADLIHAHGPLDVGRFFMLCAAHREHGYYARAPVMGPEGDFLTAPEISPLFGELLGLACVAHWQACGRPTALRLVELGPGEGTLMADLWRALAVDPACRRAVVSVELVEISPALRRRQQQRLAGLPLVFHTTVDSLPSDLPLFGVANEFFDALPLRQYVRTSAGFCERLVTLDEHGALTFTLSPHAIPASAFADPRYQELPAGSVVEIAPAREAVAATLALKLRQAGGIVYVIDYGYDEMLAGDTLQAVYRHQRVSPFALPGLADLSAHVDFRALLRAARAEGAHCYGPIPQGEFLRRLGIELRLAHLKHKTDPETARRLAAGVERLVSPQAMGELFRAAAIAGAHHPVPPGFTTAEQNP